MTLPQQLTQEIEPEENIILYKRRWLILIIYGFASFLNATLLTTFAPISPQIVQFYGLTEDQVDFLSLLFIITFAPGIICSVYFSRGHGFSTCFKVGSLLQAIGTALRMMIYIVPSPNPTFWYVMMFIGQIICGLSQPLLTSISSQLANQWFAKNESIAAQFIGSLSNPLGIAMGALFARAVVQMSSTVDRGIQVIVITQALGSGLVLILGLLYFDENPPTPPTLTATAIEQQKQNVIESLTNQNQPAPIEQSFDRSADDDDLNHVSINTDKNRGIMQGDMIDGDSDENISIVAHFFEVMGPAIRDFKHLITDLNFLCLVVPFGLGMCIFNAIVSLPNKVLGPFAPDVDASNMTATIICVGLVSCILYSVVLEVTKRFRLILKIGYLFAALSVCFFFSQLHENISQTYVYALFCILGFFIIPLLPLAIENGQEMTYPIPPQITAAILLSAGQIPSIPMLLIFMQLLKQDDYVHAKSPLRSHFGIVVSSLLCIAVLMTMFYSGESKRQDANEMRDGEYAEMNDDDYESAPNRNEESSLLLGSGNPQAPNDKYDNDRIIKFSEPKDGDIIADMEPIKTSQ